MIEALTILLFCMGLIACGVLGQPILYGLGAGLLIFCSYALWKTHSPVSTAKMMIKGVKTAGGVLTMFVFIGALTGLWRASGTVSALVSFAATLFTPTTLLMMTFASCSVVSFLIGTSFGTAATMGVVCAAIDQSAGIDPVLMGGAILSGSFFGDRCSPVSSSAYLVAELSGTTVNDNVPRMLASAAIATVLCLAAYLALGVWLNPASAITSVGDSISQGFAIEPVIFLPALAVLVLPLLCRNGKLTLLISSAIAFALCLLVQGEDPLQVVRSCFLGFCDEGKSALVQGGGVISMVYPGAVVCLSSAYAGIFQGTGLLKAIEKGLKELSKKVGMFGTCLVTSVATSCISCNQTLAIILTNQLYGPLQKDNQRLALELEDSVVLLSAAIPWSIASLVVLQVSSGAPAESIAFAFFLFLVPLTRLLGNVIKGHRAARVVQTSTAPLGNPGK